MRTREISDSSLDSSVILDFTVTGSAGLLDLALPGRILLSDLVMAELTNSGAAVSPRCHVVPLTTDEEIHFLGYLRRTYSRLGLSELGAIAVAHFHRAIFFTNDSRARSAATALGIEVSGTLGILRSGVSVGAIIPDRAVQLMEEMVSAGASFSRELIDGFRRSMLTDPDTSQYDGQQPSSGVLM